MDWRIYYGDGSEYTDRDGPPEKAPGWNVQIIAQSNDSVGRELIHRCDYYLREGEDWIGVDLIGLVDHLVARGILKVGRCLPTEDYRDIIQRAIADPELPRKSGNFPSELRGFRN